VPLRPDDVNLVARLAHLRLDDTELAEITPQLARILEYMAKLDQLDVSAVEGTSHVARIPCPLREDCQGASLPADDALRDAPEALEGMFSVPRIIG